MLWKNQEKTLNNNWKMAIISIHALKLWKKSVINNNPKAEQVSFKAATSEPHTLNIKIRLPLLLHLLKVSRLKNSPIKDSSRF